jgi:putative transposase
VYGGPWRPPLSSRHVAARLEERGGPRDHAPLPRWVGQDSAQLAEALQRRKRPVWVSWGLDAPSIQVTGPGDDLYRAVAKSGQSSAVLLTEQRDEPAAKRWLTQAIRRHGVPETSPLDGRAAKEAASQSDTAEPGTARASRQVKYLNHLVEHAQRGGPRVPRPRLGCKACGAAQDP